MASARWVASMGLALAVMGATMACSKREAPAPARSVEPVEAPAPRPIAAGTPWRDDLRPLLGQRLTVEGIARDAKLGALIEDDGRTLWIDGLASWPPALAGRRVRATGTLIERADLPVFVPKPDEPARSGIPAPPGADLETLRRRFLLEGARFESLE